MGQSPAQGFPAFPPTRRRRAFARSWWGNAWLQALDRTSLSPEPLTRGRAYAYAGHVGSITVSPGRIAAAVHDGDEDTPYQARMLVEQLTDAEWARFLDQVAAKAGHIAALLDRDMPHDLVEAAESAGVRLLPEFGDLQPECDCPGWDHPCKHAAALCHQVSWLLDDDPFVLLLMRGRGERQLLDQLQGRERRGTPPGDRGTLPGDPGAPAAVEAKARTAMAVTRPGTGSAASAAAARDIHPDGLALLVADAALRAADLLGAGEGADPPPVLDQWQDTVRLAAAHPDAPALRRLRLPAGRSDRELARAVQAWGFGGLAALALLEREWSPSAQDLAWAHESWRSAWEDEDVPDHDVARNRWTLTGRGVQLRLGRDRRWYPYRQEPDGWWPSGPPDRDPAAALAQLLPSPA